MAALPYVEDEPTLRDLYLELLGASMDADAAVTAHPAFVGMTPDEARIMKYFSFHEQIPVISVVARLKPPSELGRYIARIVSSVGVDAGCELTELTPADFGRGSHADALAAYEEQRQDLHASRVNSAPSS